MGHHYTDAPPDILKKLIPEVDRNEFGPTGRFPFGKYGDNDEGEIAFGVAADKKNGKVLVDFGKSIRCVGMNREQAIEFGKSLLQKADDLLDINKTD